MTIDYARAQKVFRAAKGALTRAKKKGPQAVIAACTKAERDFTAAGPWPDAWSNWARAYDDAAYELRRTGGDAPPNPFHQ